MTKHYSQAMKLELELVKWNRERDRCIQRARKRPGNREAQRLYVTMARNYNTLARQVKAQLRATGAEQHKLI